MGRTPDLGVWATAQKVHDIWFSPRRWFSTKGYVETEVDRALEVIETTFTVYEKFADRVNDISNKTSINGDAIRLELQLALRQLEKARMKGSL